MKPARFHAEASQELILAARWYEKQRQGLAERFFDEVDAVIQQVRERPRSFPAVEIVEDIPLRRALLHRFPYALVFAELGNELRIFAVAHTKRAPRYWMRRLSKSG